MSNGPKTCLDAPRNTFRLQPSPSSSIDGDPDNYGVHHSASDPDSRMSQHTSVRSVPGRMTDDGRTTSIMNSVSTRDRRASPAAESVQRVGITLSKLFKPERKVGKAPGFTRELRTILSDSCASYSPTLTSAYDVLMWSNRA